ncbi:MAG: tol-pal system protein YbgF, partial [Nitrospirae bacterium]
RSAYEAALKEIRSGDRRKGVAAMEAFAKAHPHTALTDNAFFWIGQGYYALGDYRNAILNFDNLLIRFPDSDKAPGALLKEGLSFLALAKEGKGGATFDDARLALQQVVHDYPGTREAKLAKEALAKIEGK